jgi:hypothetical protein
MLATTLATGSSFALPNDEIKVAVIAGGAADVDHASRDTFMRAFTVVAHQVKPRDLPEYVAAAIQLRPDLTGRIVGRAVRIVAREDRRASCPLVTRIVTVAIAAQPDKAVTIARAAIRAMPGLARYIIAAASAAAPEQRSEIAALETNYSLALLSSVTRDSEAEPWHGGGTLNPANVLDLRESSPIISPEQPPSH